jgi:hypothetical protein
LITTKIEKIDMEFKEFKGFKGVFINPSYIVSIEVNRKDKSIRVSTTTKEFFFSYENETELLKDIKTSGIDISENSSNNQHSAKIPPAPHPMSRWNHVDSVPIKPIPPTYDNKKKSRVAIVWVFLGELPSHFDYTLKSVYHNRDFDWLLFTDQIKEEKTEGNITYFPITLEEIEDRVSRVLGKASKILNPNKLCDIRPAYADIFSDYLADYEWFGWGDLDVIYGNFNDYITKEILDEYDVIAPMDRNLFGPLTLIKKKHMYLYKKIPNLFELVNTLNPNSRKGYFNVDEKAFGEVVRTSTLKIFSKRRSGNHDIDIVRCGRQKTPATWDNGVVRLDTFTTDYPPSYIKTHGDDTLCLHLPRTYTFKNIDDKKFRIL